MLKKSKVHANKAYGPSEPLNILISYDYCLTEVLYEFCMSPYQFVEYFGKYNTIKNDSGANMLIILSIHELLKK